MLSKHGPSRRGTLPSFPVLTFSRAGRAEEGLQEAEKASWRRGPSNWPMEDRQVWLEVEEVEILGSVSKGEVAIVGE